MKPPETLRYDDAIVRKFVVAAVVWGLVGMIVGLLLALQLAIPDLNFAPYLTFGRLRPLHTNAVIFAFAGNGLFAAVYYSTQRLVKARPLSDGRQGHLAGHGEDRVRQDHDPDQGPPGRLVEG
ncbi:MAG: cbb3-type cytochrome c oxidase subunit I, partial [Kofleriaceae bacterium]|nr:cbb3-type cytochrome c oxidase subunit I [Kofleriaceae bacterium]